MRSKKYDLFLIYFFLKKKRDNEKIFMELDYFTYFCFSSWKWLHIEVPCDFLHTNSLFCCLVHFDPWYLSRTLLVPGQFSSSRSLLLRCSLHSVPVKPEYIFIKPHLKMWFQVNIKNVVHPNKNRIWLNRISFSKNYI